MSPAWTEVLSARGAESKPVAQRGPAGDHQKWQGHPRSGTRETWLAPNVIGAWGVERVDPHCQPRKYVKGSHRGVRPPSRGQTEFHVILKLGMTTMPPHENSCPPTVCMKLHWPPADRPHSHASSKQHPEPRPQQLWGGLSSAAPAHTYQRAPVHWCDGREPAKCPVSYAMVRRCQMR